MKQHEGKDSYVHSAVERIDKLIKMTKFRKIIRHSEINRKKESNQET
jgi:hypothetical protein